MKYSFFAVSAFICILTACTKPDDIKLVEEDQGCIERVFTTAGDHSIDSSDVQTVHDLFAVNEINDSRFRFYKYIHDTLQTLYPPYARYDQKNVRVEQFTNGLPIFTDDLVFLFLNDEFEFKGGNLTGGTSLDTSPRLTLAQIRHLFIDAMDQFDHTGTKYADSCFKAEFGYFNVNTGISNSPEVLVKAWKVTLRNRVYPSEYPVAYYRDDNANLIFYDNGIRMFK